MTQEQSFEEKRKFALVEDTRSMTTYTKFKEYIWLVNTIYHAKAITLADINKRWLETEMSEGVPLSRTTFHRHRIAIEEMFGLFIECDKKNGNRYYIGNAHVLNEDSIQNWILSTLSVGNLVVESQSLSHRILLENVPSGGENLKTVIKAMKENRMYPFVCIQLYGLPDMEEIRFKRCRRKVKRTV